MKLDRNINGTGRGKYGLVKNRVLQEFAAVAKAAGRNALNDADVEAMKVVNAINFLEAMGVIEWGEERTESEFFVVRLRDQHAQGVLARYASNAMGAGDGDLAADVFDLAARSGLYSPFCKKPD